MTYDPLYNPEPTGYFSLANACSDKLSYFQYIRFG